MLLLALTYVPIFVAAVVLADFISGLVHWAEDAYARADTPIIGRWIANANIEHHAKPRAFVARSWLSSSWDLLLVGTGIIAFTWWTETLSWAVWVFVLFAVNANQIHKWAHQNPRENPLLVTWLQRARLLQTQRHHARHHSGKKNTHYCSITNFVNPVLERLNFWERVERFNEFAFGLKRRPDPTVK
jgi:plasmanylethanolamine desaturase